MELVVIEKLNHIDDFLKNFTSAHTRKAYEGDLKDYSRFTNGIDIFSLSTLIRYREHLVSTSSSATAVRKLASIRSFMDFLAEREIIKVNSAKYLKLPKVQTEQHTPAFTDDEVVAMLTAPDISDFYGSMHRFVIFLLFNLGIRRSELTTLTVGSISSHRGIQYITVKGKGSKQRLIPFTSEMSIELERYLRTYAEYTKLALTDSDFLVQTRADVKNDSCMSSSTVYKIIRKYAKQCKITRSVSPHSCRATMISHLLEKNISPRSVANLAGHSSISTTVDIYDRKRDSLTNQAIHQLNYGRS